MTRYISISLEIVSSLLSSFPRLINLFISYAFLILLFCTIFPVQVFASTIELPECVVKTHCVKENFKVNNVEDAFQKTIKILSTTPRTKIVEQSNLYVHAEAKTKWRRYTDDFLLIAIPEKSVIQVRSESRIGIGDNGVNKKRVDNFAYRLMKDQD